MMTVTHLSLVWSSLCIALLRINSSSEEGSFPGVHVILGLTWQVQGLRIRNIQLEFIAKQQWLPWNLWRHSCPQTGKSQTCVFVTWKLTRCPLISADQGEAYTSCLFPARANIEKKSFIRISSDLFIFEPGQTLRSQNKPVVSATS